MNKKYRPGGFFLLFFALCRFSLMAQEIDRGVSLEIRNMIESQNPETGFFVANTSLYSTESVLRFYAQREFKQAWTEDAKLSCNAYEMRYYIQQSKFDGLEPEEYHLRRLNEYFDQFEKLARLGQFPNDVELASLDLILTDAYLMLAAHLFTGKVDPESLKAGWDIQRKTSKVQFDERLQAAIENSEIRKSLEAFYPIFTIYPRMRRNLMEYHEMEKKAPQNWERQRIPKSIKPMEVSSQVPVIREKLLFWGDLKEYDFTEADLYDSILMRAVQYFQQKRGLNPDGVIGNSTIAALNKSPSDLIKQATVNLERLRWLPDSVLEEFFLVNIANFSMDFIRNRDTLLTSNAIVGRAYRKTPVFNAPMSYLVFSPTWTVPPTILYNDVIPAVKRDINYLRSKNMRILTFSGQEVNPASVDWSKISGRNFPYMVRQDPGPSNSLGLVKFMFPNKYNVYIHDTPSRDLFARDDRALSSGCIRIQKPFELAKLLLAEEESWTDEKIRAAMNSRREQTVMLKKQIPVVILYLTFWSNSQGQPMVREDIYSRDEDLYKALAQRRAQLSAS